MRYYYYFAFVRRMQCPRCTWCGSRANISWLWQAERKTDGMSNATRSLHRQSQNTASAKTQCSLLRFCHISLSRLRPKIGAEGIKQSGCSRESVCLFITWTNGGISMKLFRITHCQVHVTTMTLRETKIKITENIYQKYGQNGGGVPIDGSQ